jgi:hypothetical protein
MNHFRSMVIQIVAGREIITLFGWKNYGEKWPAANRLKIE